MSEISILLVGDTERREFGEARAALEPLGRVSHAADTSSAIAELAADRVNPDVIVLAQAYPGQFSARAIDRLRRLAPLTRVLGLLGSWCEGEMRTGQPWPATIRIYWHQWLPQCQRELDALGKGYCPAWGLPMTATDEERLLRPAVELLVGESGLVAIHSQWYEMYCWLSEACRRRGYSTIWLRPGGTIRLEGARAAIFDGTDCGRAEVDRLEQMAAALAPAPVVALLDFPRIEDHDRAIAAGAGAVMSKPLLLDDLFWQLNRLLRDQPNSAISDHSNTP